MSLAEQPTGPPRANLYLFGDLEIRRGEAIVRLPTRKAELLLAYLALFPEAHSREKLAALFWGDSSDEHASGSLRKALTALRRELGPDVLLADRQSARLNPDFPLWIDTREFDRLIIDRRTSPVNEAADPDERSAAIDLYRGELLRDYYDDWIGLRRASYQAACLEELLALTQAMRTRSDYARAAGFAQRALAADQANERAHQHLMFCYLAWGKRSEALQQYETCRRVLEQELGVEPAAETTALYRWILQGPAAHPASEALLTNLPVPLSSFIGREDETAQVKSLLAASIQESGTEPARLVTLTGPGGSGKTRLAIQVAADLLDAFPDGVWWVELASLSEGARVPQAVAKALGVRESPEEVLIDTMTAFLRDRRLLLILDNCEHLVTECAVLAESLLSRLPRLKILATSRQALGLPGEYALPVPTLPVPRHTRWALPDSLFNFEGTRLFVERARAANPGFSLTPENAPAVMQVCARLDGIPLAIELAAMWMKTISVEELAVRLDERFDLLTLGGRTAPPRHQTLRGVLDWSYNLLPDAERALFRRLSVFAGGASLPAIESAAPDGQNPGASAPTLILLNRLVDKSLVIVEPGPGRTRYRMLETIRDYAREKLRAAGESEPARGRHLDYFVDLAEEGQRQLRGPRQKEWLEWLDRELDNFRAALEWAMTSAPRRGLLLAGALVWYWNLNGHWSEGPAWLIKLLNLPDAAGRTQERASALVAAANLAFWGSDDYAAAQAWLEEAIEIYRASSPAGRWGLGDALALYGELLRERDESSLAEAALEESCAIGEELGEDGNWIRAWASMSLGHLADSPATARQRFETSAALFREMGDRAQLPVVLARLAWFHMGQKEYAAAEVYARESTLLTEQIGDVMGAAWMLKLEGDLAQSQGDYGHAAAAYSAGIERFRTLRSNNGIAETLVGLGKVLLKEGDPEGARRAWDEALPLFAAMGRTSTYDWLGEQRQGIAAGPGGPD